MATINYKQTKYGEFTNSELLSLIESNPEWKEWLEAMANQVRIQMKEMWATEFGIESAKEVVVAMLAKGYYQIPDSK